MIKNRFAFLIFIFSVNLSIAATPQEQLLEEQHRQGRKQTQQIKNIGKGMAAPIKQPQIIEKPKQPKNTKSLPCFNIKEIIFEGIVDGVPSSQHIVDSQKGTCLNSLEIKHLMDQMNHFYQEQGFITTRVYIPEQNLNSRVLQFEIKPGFVSAYRYQDTKELDARITTAFPLEKGDLLNVRQLEQGLDNFNSPRSQSGKFKLYPAKGEFGGSIVEVIPQISKPWHVSLSFNNSGYESTGEDKGAFDFSYDNLLGINDTLSIGLQSHLTSDDVKKSTSANINYLLPYKNWQWIFGYNEHEYRRTVFGVNQNFVADGTSDVASINFKRLLSRNQTTRHYLYGGLALKESHSFIENIEVGTQRRDLSVLSLGFEGDKSLAAGSYLSWQLGANRGLSAFGAMDDVPGPAISKFLSLDARLNYQRKLGQKSSYKSLLAFQYSDDEMPGSEQFGVGGRSSVRGFHEESLFGNTGFYWTNELEHELDSSNDIQYLGYIALDTGRVKEPATASWSQNHLAGGVIGLRMKHPKTTFLLDLAYAKSLSQPDEFKKKQSASLCQYRIQFLNK